NCADTPKEFDDSDQFLMWFTEWSEDFCFHKDIENKKLQTICSFTNCESASSKQKSECLNACRTYNMFINKWHIEYINQHYTYDDLHKNIKGIKEKDTPTFLSKKCGDKCSCFNNKDVNTVDELFETPPKKYENNCKCAPTPP
ncbi:putative EMP1-like protein, partial [Plasmodium gaboni]